MRMSVFYVSGRSSITDYFSRFNGKSTVSTVEHNMEEDEEEPDEEPNELTDNLNEDQA